MSDYLETLSFGKGTLLSEDTLLLSMTVDDLPDKPHAILLLIDGGPIEELDWSCVGIATLPGKKDTGLVLGQFGQVLLVQGESTTREKIDMPDHLGPLRNIKAIGDCLYAVGTHRQVYKRDHNGVWIHIAEELPLGQAGKSETFESITGFGENELYACGWDGEIWQYKDQKWYHCNTPTEMILTDMCCGRDGQVYACGQAGTVICGRGKQWTAVDNGGLITDLFGICSFENEIYIVSRKAIFQIIDNKIQHITPLPPGHTYYNLFMANNKLWSVGPKDIISFDGTTWEVFESSMNNES